ncbi:hypothetical protein HUG10_21180 (plasmid) [Halorarum halophilum]|uniref:Uncharacterized protein n=1 Tax=Halorarum halophilum TaxID=2743090 RepID=A0A7D5KQ75_9EURY|nr:hypothetical protein [Halobaculum halophilum]QLG30102.1 hypothetical protein HUG10_21180 [Halobaculum halophilum]
MRTYVGFEEPREGELVWDEEVAYAMEGPRGMRRAKAAIREALDDGAVMGTVVLVDGKVDEVRV